MNLQYQSSNFYTINMSGSNIFNYIFHTNSIFSPISLKFNFQSSFFQFIHTYPNMTPTSSRNRSTRACTPQEEQQIPQFQGTSYIPQFQGTSYIPQFQDPNWKSWCDDDVTFGFIGFKFGGTLVLGLIRV